MTSKLDPWISEILARLNRKKAYLVFTEHLLKHRSLAHHQRQICSKIVRCGKVEPRYSNDNKICFKGYLKSNKITVFVITEFDPKTIKVITAFKKRRKH